MCASLHLDLVLDDHFHPANRLVFDEAGQGLARADVLHERQGLEPVLESDVVISAITLAELECGITCSGAAELANRAQLEKFIGDVPVAPFEALAARACGPTRFASRERSRDALDQLIAAHALSLEVTLVTNNESDFVIYPGLKVENWVGSH